MITERLELTFLVFESATDDEITAFWDDTLTMNDTSKSVLDKKEKLKSFYKHCCQAQNYSFCVKRCGASVCEICKPLRMDSKLFKEYIFFLTQRWAQIINMFVIWHKYK